VCGILAMVGDRWAGSFAPALEALAPRGPDDRGEWHEPGVHLGHRRLCIIDPEGGHEPMATADGRFWITFNGEIYNFRELRRELEPRGLRPRTRSDAEVLVEGFAREGAALLPRLDGIFAFAVWDRVRRVLFAARDRFGIKPLAYSTTEGLVVASTLEPFFALRGFPRRVCYPALRDYLATDSVPAPMTILADVAALPPASWLEYEAHSGTLRTGRYWDVPAPRAQATRFEALVEAVAEAIDESVRRQLVSDVPLGAFLSGGIDSSLVVHAMARAGEGRVRTFSVRFDPGGGYDESAFARRVAEHVGSDHTELDAAEVDGEAFARAVAALDQPLADPAYLPTRALAALTRRHVTVALSGDGGDEVFGGYARFLQGEASYPDGPLRRLFRRAIAAGVLPGALLRRTLAGRERVIWNRVRLGPWPVSRKSLARVLDPAALAACRPRETFEKWLDSVVRWSGRMDADGLMRGDLWTYLSDNCLTKTDRASMGQGLEVRVPMLGNAVVDLVLPEPAEVKLRGGLKAILVEIARRRLPREVWDRPKHGFAVPLRQSIRGAWRGRCEEWLSAAPRRAPFLDQRALRRRWRLARAGRGDMHLMYTLIVLLGWLESHPLEP
jgi:asparagine synthase (glutamine-hydrolysing)